MYLKIEPIEQAGLGPVKLCMLKVDPVHVYLEISSIVFGGVYSQ